MNSSLFQALGIIDCAILRYMGRKHFEVIFTKDEWFFDLLPEATGNSKFELAENSAFLNDFLLDAEDFWQKHNTGQIHSGIWTENTANRQLHLEAIAAYAGGERFIVINNMQHEYKEQQKTLQVARELLISNDKIQAQHQYLNDRLSKVLSQNASLLELNLPIQQAIEHASIGVIITDQKFKPITFNPASWSIFELDPQSADTTPLAIVTDMFDDQFPEIERLKAHRSSWSGDLYWHYPPRYHKWLQCEIHPVMDEGLGLKHWVITLADVTRIKYLLQTNEDLALHDSLTGLPNRQYFWQTLEQSIRAEEHFFVMYVDIDKFKNINELHGHLTGDSMLISVSKRIKKRLQRSDFLARIGADEFAIVIKPSPDIELEPGSDILDRVTDIAAVLREDSRSPHFTERDERCNLPLRIGIASYPADASTTEAIMKAADLALHAAKLFSQDPIQFYSSDLKTASEARLRLESQLREAIAKEQLQVYLQPIYDLSSGRIVKAEALLRWFPTKDSSIGPDVFIPIAEQTGLIYPLGKWVITKVCELLTVFKQHNINIKLAMNVSPRQVSDRHLFEFIKSTAERLGVDAHKLELELTEGVLVDNYNKAQKLLNSLREMGVTIAIDDFGTGYSSLSYLKHLPIDHLKIDRSLISDIDTNEDDRAIVLAILAMATQLRLKVIAEGVETMEQQEFLKQHRCASAQGFYYAKPMPLESFIAFMK
ncbi:EAL domain-containing protein [Alteromonas sp. ASW11-36]|uniref:EAL domain-containing protein n=1 Tax=Alteromonas arenosi TaxID=3055817 RepID=A0ABT7SSU2_9ALTE|nr:GGDEF domain-containing phosphodiesterase [Alteromonas sp. ASW11-36]MDM7859054.1 EAL domain-containing protein [Alteromonas sp. ASW11-36]